MGRKIKILLFITALFLNTVAFSPSAKASWPDYIGNIAGVGVDQILDQIKAALIAALKQAAIQTLNETVNNLIAGTTQAGSLFINDWEDYLFKSPRASAGSHMNDFFTVTTRGKSSGNFQSSCEGGSFTEWRSAGAKESVNVEIDFTALQSDFEEYACDAASMFDKGSWEAYNAFMQPNNNPIAYALIAESEYERKLNEEIAEAEIKAGAYKGFKATETKDGIVLTPGSITEEITASANTVGDKALASATTWQEIAGAVVGKIASQVIKKGIGNARQNVQNQINDSICDGSQTLRDELGNLTPNGNLMGDLGIGSLGSSSGSKSCTLK